MARKLASIWLGLLLVVACLPGCKTHEALRRDTIRATNTLADMNYAQVLNNLAMFVDNPSAVPSVALINAGTVTVQDQKTFNGNATWSPTLTFAQQGGGALPILSVLLGPGYQREVTENWSTQPIVDADNLKRIRCAYQLLLEAETSNCHECRKRIKEYFLGEGEPLECLIPKGWFHAGCKKDVPKDACYVGSYGCRYVWVTREGLEGLARFTLTVMDLASGKLHAAQRTVVKTYKGEAKPENLEKTQITTTEGDIDALTEGRYRPERERNTGGPNNRGLFFVPH